MLPQSYSFSFAFSFSHSTVVTGYQVQSLLTHHWIPCCQTAPESLQVSNKFCINTPTALHFFLSHFNNITLSLSICFIWSAFIFYILYKESDWLNNFNAAEQIEHWHTSVNASHAGKRCYVNVSWAKYLFWSQWRNVELGYEWYNCSVIS